MPKYPPNVRKHGRRFIHRAQVQKRRVETDLGEDSVEMRRLARILNNKVRVKRQEKRSVCGTVADFVQTWIDDYVHHERVEKDWTTAEYRIREYVLPIIGKQWLDEVRRRDIKKLALSLAKRGMKVNTQRHVLSDARCMFSYAVDLELIDSNPFSGGKILPMAPKAAPDPLTDAEIETIKDVLSDRPHFVDAIRLALNLGLRWSEQRDLQWRHVDLGPEPTITVDDTKDGGWRRVPLDPESVSILKRWREQTSSIYVMAWRPPQAEAAPKLTRERCGLKWKWHRLRKTFACRYLRKPGSTIEALAKLLGHHSIKTTEIYADLDESTVHAEFRRVVGQ